MTAELEAKIAELETANADLVRQLGEATETNTKIAADVDALRDELRELDDIKARLLKIENTPLPKAGAPAEPARELSVPSGLVITKTEIYREVQ
jgi:regulator of replication initiation timing